MMSITWLFSTTPSQHHRARHVLEPIRKRVVGFGVVWGMRNGSDACDKPGHEVRKVEDLTPIWWL